MAIATRVFHPEGDIILLLTRREKEEHKDEAGKVGPSSEERDVKESFAMPNPKPSPQRESSDNDYIRMQVSSMHLKLVSPVFKAMLSGGFKEDRELQEKGFLEIPLPDDDPEALTILLNIIHCHLNKVPRRVEGIMLTKMAILVDYYQLQDVIEFHSDMWVDEILNAEGIKSLFDRGICAELLRCICVCWVFRKAKLFYRVTAELVWIMEGNISEVNIKDLPLPDPIIVALNTMRSKLLNMIVPRLRAWRSKYLNGPVVCEKGKEHCDQMILGGIVQVLEGANLDKIAIKSLVHMLENKKISRLCGGGKCGILYDLKDNLGYVTIANRALNLYDFVALKKE